MRWLAGLLWLVLAIPAFAGICEQQYFQGVRPSIQAAALKRQLNEVCYQGAYSAVHSGLTRTPLWSAEHLTPERLAAARGLPRKDTFHAEESLPSSVRAELTDYKFAVIGTGKDKIHFDRGHLSPNADMPDAEAQHASFSLANIMPQVEALNRGEWADAEMGVRYYTKRSGEVYVITGTLFLGAEVNALYRRVLVPTHIFKIVFDPRLNRAGVYFTSNDASFQVRQISLIELERVAGIDFLPHMTAAEKGQLLPLYTCPSGEYRCKQL